MRIAAVLVFSVLLNISIHSEVIVKFLHLGKEYNLSPVNRKSFQLTEPFKPLSEVDSSQTYRILVSSIDKSRINGLQFAGDQLTFNNVTIVRSGTNQYRIIDEDSRVEVIFGIGDFDSLLIYSYLDFGFSSTLINKIASVFTVKYFLKKMNGELEEKLEIPEILTREQFDQGILKYIEKNKEQTDFILKCYEMDSSGNYRITWFGAGFESRKKIREILSLAGFQMDYGLVQGDREKQLQVFIDQLKAVNRNEVFAYLKQFVEFNIRLLPDNSLQSDWISPYDLYYNRRGNYKSIAYFYYFVLTRLGFEGRTYLVTELKLKERDDLARLKKMKTGEKQALESQYRNVKVKYNREILLDYHPPELSKSVFLVTINMNNRWLYTTGSVWVDNQIYRPERVCPDFYRRGCYYTTIYQNDVFYYNLPLNEESLEWDLFYEVR